MLQHHIPSHNPPVMMIEQPAKLWLRCSKPASWFLLAICYGNTQRMCAFNLI
jgi:hypothetical protein